VGRLASEIGEPEVPVSADGQEETSGPGPSDPLRSSSRSGEIASSRDVEETLDRLIAYYAKQEPSSPVPILLARAKKLVGADFMTIVNEIAPGGADNVKLIGGLE